MKSLYLRSSNNPQLQSYYLTENSVDLLKENISEIYGIPIEDQVLYSNGNLIYKPESLVKLESTAVIDVNLKLYGGKGGLRNTLRGEMRKNLKTTNFDSSRDLLGRRIRDVKLKEKLIEWARKKKEEDKKIQHEVNEYKRMNKEIVGVRRNVRLPQEFKDKLEKWDYEMKSSVMEGLRRSRGGGVGMNEEESLEEPTINKKILTEREVVSVIEGRNQAFLERLKKDYILLEEAGTEESLQEKRNALCQDENILKKNLDIETIKVVYPEIKLEMVMSLEDSMNLGGEHLKHELSRLGLKCGGNLEERAKRLFEIKMNPRLLFNPKYIAKKSK